MMHARWINGNLAYWDTHSCRIVDAFGATAYKFIEQGQLFPTDGSTTITGYTVTVVSGGAGDSLASIDRTGGGFAIVTANQENDGFSIQHKGEHFKLAANKPAYFGITFKIGDVTQTDFMIGLCITDTDLLGGITDGVYFRKVDGAATVAFVLEKNTTETTGNVATMVDDTYMTLEFYFDGTNVDSWVDGVKQTRLAITNLPDDEELTPSIEFLTGEGGSNTMTVMAVRAFQFN